MDPTTMTVWLYVLSGLMVALTVLVALDLKRHWRVPEERIRMLVARALQTVELEHMTGPIPVQRAGRAEPDRPPAGAAGASTPEPNQWTCSPTTGALVRSRPDLLVPPPMVGGDTLRDWLIHYRAAPEAWMDVTEEFYARAAQAPEVADYFVGVDWPALKRHFMAALVLLTHTGVTRELPATMAARHHDVRNSAGDPITPEIFDAVADTLVGVLRDFDVPVGTLNQLGRVVAPFRMAIAREKVPTAEAKARAAWPTWSDQRGGSVTDDGSA
jgi:truncated hemoglobin YjbI